MILLRKLLTLLVSYCCCCWCLSLVVGFWWWFRWWFLVVVGCHAAAERVAVAGSGRAAHLWQPVVGATPVGAIAGSQVETGTNHPVTTLQSGRKLPNLPKSWKTFEILAIWLASLFMILKSLLKSLLLRTQSFIQVTLSPSNYRTFLFHCDHRKWPFKSKSEWSIISDQLQRWWSEDLEECVGILRFWQIHDFGSFWQLLLIAFLIALVQH